MYGTSSTAEVQMTKNHWFFAASEKEATVRKQTTQHKTFPPLLVLAHLYPQPADKT